MSVIGKQDGLHIAEVAIQIPDHDLRGMLFGVAGEADQVGEHDAHIAFLDAQPALDHQLDYRGVHGRVQRFLDLGFQGFDRELRLL